MCAKTADILSDAVVAVIVIAATATLACLATHIGTPTHHA